MLSAAAEPCRRVDKVHAAHLLGWLRKGVLAARLGARCCKGGGPSCSACPGGGLWHKLRRPGLQQEVVLVSHLKLDSSLPQQQCLPWGSPLA